MAIAGKPALLAGAKGRPGKSSFAGAASTPAAVSVRSRKAPSPAPLLRLPPLGRSAAARRSPTVVRVARLDSSYAGDSGTRMDGVNVQRVSRISVLFMGLQASYFLKEQSSRELKRKAVSMVSLGLTIWICILMFKWRAVLLAAIS